MNYILAGYGKFGRLAFRRLRDEARASHITVIDPVADLSHIRNMSEVTVVDADAASYLAQEGEHHADALVIPMTPFHLAARYLQALVENLVVGPFPLAVLARLPNPITLSKGVVCFSLATHVCPDDCDEGEECKVTGESRNPPLYQRIESLPVEDRPLLVVRSLQILPGVGGYPMQDLLSAPNQARHAAKRHISTACRCHGIMTALEFRA